MKKLNSTLISSILLIIYLIQLVSYYSGMSISLKAIREIQGGLGGPVVIILEKLNFYTIIGLFFCVFTLVMPYLSKRTDDRKDGVIIQIIIVVLILFLGFKIYASNLFIEGQMNKSLEELKTDKSIIPYAKRTPEK
jgi:cytochrome b subunit of formate dehydrogenase